MKFLFSVLIVLLPCSIAAQTIFRIDSLPPQGLLLDKGWKWHAGDNPAFAKPDFDDATWESIDPTRDIMELPQVRQAGIGWLRLHLQIDSTVLQQQALAFVVYQAVASELYSNGQFVQRLGTVTPKPDEVDAVVNYDQIGLPLTGKSGYTLAVRIAFQPYLPYNKLAQAMNPVYRVRIYTIGQFKSARLSDTIQTTYRLIKAGMFFILALLHFTFFIFYPPQKANFFFAISSLIFFQHWLGLGLHRNFIITDLDTRMYLGLLRSVLFPINYIFLVTALYTAYALPKSYYYWAAVGACALLIGIYFSNYQNGVIWLETGTIIVMTAEAIRITVMAVLRKHRGAGIILVGMVISFVGYPTRFLIQFTSLLPSLSAYTFTFEMFGTLSIPLFFSVYLAREFAFTSKSLSTQLETVQQLSAKTLTQEQEKQQILATENERLERQVTERTAELTHKNRELEIETALERVRSRTMAMFKSEELSEVATILFQQMSQLGSIVDRFSIGIFDEQRGIVDIWATDQSGTLLETRFVARLDEKTTVKRAYDGWKSGLKTLIIDVQGEELREWIRYAREEMGIPVNEVLIHGRRINHLAYFSHGYLVIQSHEPLAQELFTILQRFAGVFNLTYTRFLDLKKAEAQAREAQISTALERIRNRTLLMRDSAELSEVAVTLFEEFKGMGLLEASDQTYFCTIDRQSKSAEVWITQKDGKVGLSSFNMPLDTFPPLINVYKGWEQQSSLVFRDLTGNDLAEYLTLLASLQTLKTDQEYQHVFTTPPQRRVIVDAVYAYGTVGMVSDKPFSQEAIDTLARFAKVFEFTYTRFLDLQKAEANERETTRQASLDRVRAEIATMRTTYDLQRITPLIWKELTTLNVPFFRCGVFIMDEETEKVHTYLSAPDGQAIASFDLSYNTPGNTSQVVANWRERKIFIDHWNEVQFQDWSQSLVNQGLIQSSEHYANDAPLKQLSLHFLPFQQGMLYVGNAIPLANKEIQLAQALADTFSAAYARYQDFNRLEEAKQQVEKAFSDLKSTQVQLIQKEKMASLGELTAGIAHEIQNPLNFVNNFSEVSGELVDELKDELAKGQVEEAAFLADGLSQNLQKINHHGQRASAIVRSMLEHSRTSSGQRQPTDLNALAGEYLRLAYQGLRAKDKTFNCTLITDFDLSLPNVNVVAQDIVRVLLNLFNNAFYAVQQRSKQENDGYQPTVWVSTKTIPHPPEGEANGTLSSGEWGVTITVCDNGTGIPDSIKAKIFQPFFTTKPTGEGTGLGLSLSYDIVTKGHSGTINVESKEGEGTMFTLEFQIT